ncbi:MAG TPA: hypothetical protein VGR27_02030 [Longimicrobiaceae bacterium]|nr:hypothetical protein [Longimicrobiaceae bacterium]
MIDLPGPMMQRTCTFAAFALIAALTGIAGCEPAPAPEAATEDPPAATDTPEIHAGLHWSSQVTGSGMALLLADAAGAPLLRIACIRDPALMTIVAETFQPIASEERLSFGVDGEPFTFVADPTADRPSGVQAEAPIPGELLDRMQAAREVSAVYGAQTLGPYMPPDPEMAARFVAACREIVQR